MDGFTPEQRKAIQGWTAQRDAILREIGIYTPQLEELKKSTIAEGQNLAALHVSIAEAKGRLAELDALEERHRTSVATDVAELEVRKSRLEGECDVLSAKASAAGEKYVIITGATQDLEKAHDTMKDQSSIVNKVVGDLIETTTAHLAEAKTLMTDIRTVSTDVIDKSNENVKQTGIILEKLPKYVFELQKPIPVRRVFAAPKGVEIKPE